MYKRPALYFSIFCLGVLPSCSFKKKNNLQIEKDKQALEVDHIYDQEAASRAEKAGCIILPGSRMLTCFAYEKLAGCTYRVHQAHDPGVLTVVISQLCEAEGWLVTAKYTESLGRVHMICIKPGKTLLILLSPEGKDISVECTVILEC